MNDQLIIDYVKSKKNGIKWNNLPNDINEYLLNRFKDCKNNKESYLRILFKIDEVGICPICGKKLKYQGINKAPYANTCGNKKCQSKLRNIKSNQTKLEKYGKIGYVNSEKSKQTKLERYGDKNYNNSEKHKQTCIKRYGVSSYTKTNECKNKIKNTCIERYGVTNGGCSKQALEKIKQTCLDRYGVESSWKIKGVVEKAKHTKLKRYGNENYTNTEKMKQTCLERYGVDNGFKTKEAQEKYKQTCLKNHGVNHNWKIPSEHDLTHTPEALEKKKQTSLKNWGVEYPHQCQEIIDKVNKTKKKNHTFNKSESEDQSYFLIKEKYPDVIRQYKSNIYPFACDFYIPSLDLYIECNYFWMHGGKIYEGNEEDNLILQNWNTKSKTNKVYKNAIKTWTYYDIKKYQTAKENKLNYKIFWNINELKEYINKGEI